MITIGNYVKAGTLSEAYELNQKKTNAIVAGGLWIRMGNRHIATAIDLSGLGLDTITETQDEFHIGAMVSLRALELHEGFTRYTEGMLQAALGDIVGVQFRNMATVGGSIYSRFGFSDVLTAFLVLDCDVVLYKEGRISLKEYAAREHKDRDILTEMIVKKKPGHFYYRAARNTRTDFPTLAFAAAWWETQTMDVAVGARPGKAVLVEQADADTITDRVQVGTNLRGQARYRRRLLKGFAKQAKQYFEEGETAGWKSH